MSHLKKLNAPPQWLIQRKEKKYIISAHTNGHKRSHSLPLLVALRDVLEKVKTLRELRIVLKDSRIEVDGKVQTSTHGSVGLFDVIGLPTAKEYFRVILDDNGRLRIVAIDEKEHAMKICKIVGKRLVRGGRTQITLHDGRSVLAEKTVNVGDSIVLQLPERKISDVIKFEKGAYVYLIQGKHVGGHGVLEEVTGNKIVYRDAKNKTFETLKKYVVALGKGKPLMKIENGK